MRISDWSSDVCSSDLTSFLLLVFDDITDGKSARRESELNWRIAQSIVDAVRDPLVVLDLDMTVVTASRAFLKLFGVTSDEIVGRRLRDLDQGQWDVAALRELLEHVVPDSEAIRGFEVEDEFPGLGRRIFKLDAREISATGNQAGRLLVAFEDVTEARLLERHKDILAAELSHRIKSSAERRVGKECVSTSSSRWSPEH